MIMEEVDVKKIENEHLTDDPTITNLLPELPNEVLSLIIGHLTSDSESILHWRAVNPDFRDEVDQHMISLKPTELNPLTIDGIPVKNLRPTKIEDLVSITDFQNEMENFKTNSYPFPTRTLSLNPLNPKICDCTRPCDCRRLVDDEFVLFPQFCKRFGHEVRRLTFVMNFWTAMHHLKEGLHNFPNLYHLEIRMMYKELQVNSDSFKWPQNFYFSPLPQLTSLKVHIYEMDNHRLLTKFVQYYGSQIETLTVSLYAFMPIKPLTASFGGLRSEDTPNLKNLRIRFLPERKTEYVLNFLKNGNWSLKQLTLHGLKSHFLANYKLRDVMQVISKFASTLEILHLYFSDYSRIMFRLHCLSNPEKTTPDEVAKELQLDVKLPLVRECSLAYGGVKDVFLANAKLCERFENLTKLHLYDERLDEPNFIRPNYEEELQAKWWPVVSPESKLERVFIFSGTQFDDDVVIHHVSNRPNI